MTERAADAERLAKLRKERDMAPAVYRDAALSAPMRAFAWIDVDFLFQQLDTALRDVDELRAEVERLWDAAVIEQRALDFLAEDTNTDVPYLPLSERWTKLTEPELRAELVRFFRGWGKTQSELYGELKRRDDRIANQRKEINRLQDAADTKSLRHPLTGDTVIVSAETGRILETRPAASGEDVERAQVNRGEAERIAVHYHGSADGKGWLLANDIESALNDVSSAARLSGRAEKTQDGPTDEEFSATIKPLWLKAQPSRKAQEIRSSLSVSFDDDRFKQWASDFIPDYVWDLVDIAAEQGIVSGHAEMREIDEPVIAAARAVCASIREMPHAEGTVYITRVFLVDLYNYLATRDAALKLEKER